MSITVHAVVTGTYAPMLESLLAILDKAVAHAKTTDIDLVHAKLAPDMYDLALQVQEACFYAIDGVARLAGKGEAEREDASTTLPGLQAQIRATLDALRGIPPAALDGAERRDCSIAMDDKMVIAMDGERYLLGWSLPLFYFHVVTAYDILRHRGVEIGIQDFNGQVGGFIRPKAR